MDGDKYKNSGYLFLALMVLLGLGIGIYIGHWLDELQDALRQLQSNAEVKNNQVLEHSQTVMGGLIGGAIGLFIGYPFARILDGIGEIINNQSSNVLSKSTAKTLELHVGDEVSTISGEIGIIIKVLNETVLFESLGDHSHILLKKSAIQEIIEQSSN